MAKGRSACMAKKRGRGGPSQTQPTYPQRPFLPLTDFLRVRNNRLAPKELCGVLPSYPTHPFFDLGKKEEKRRGEGRVGGGVSSHDQRWGGESPSAYGQKRGPAWPKRAFGHPFGHPPTGRGAPLRPMGLAPLRPLWPKGRGGCGNFFFALTPTTLLEWGGVVFGPFL
jgi:hypothetical protein